MGKYGVLDPPALLHQASGATMEAWPINVRPRRRTIDRFIFAPSPM
jgi:hypothetical protein